MIMTPDGCYWSAHHPEDQYAPPERMSQETLGEFLEMTRHRSQISLWDKDAAGRGMWVVFHSTEEFYQAAGVLRLDGMFRAYEFPNGMIGVAADRDDSGYPEHRLYDSYMDYIHRMAFPTEHQK